MPISITVDFVNQFLAIFNQKTGKNAALTDRVVDVFFEISFEGSDFKIHIFANNINELRYSMSGLGKRYGYGSHISNYVSKQDMEEEGFGEFHLSSIKITKKTTAESLVNRVVKVLPQWIKYHHILEDKSIEGLNSNNKQKAFVEELKSKYKISGGMDNKVGYIKNHRCEVIVSADKGDLMIRGLSKDNLFAILNILKSS